MNPIARAFSLPGPLRTLASACLLAALAACSSPPPKPPPVPVVKVVLLPQADGSASGVVVQAGKATQTLTQPYQRASAIADRPPVVDQADPAQVRQAYDALFRIAPPRPVRFVLYFQPGTTRLSGESQAQLPLIQEDMARYPGAEVLVVGHTDTKGSGDSNDALSLRRAQQVRDLLVQQGLNAKQVEASGRGEREPAVATANEVDEPRNRRVEVTLR